MVKVTEVLINVEIMLLSCYLLFPTFILLCM